MSMSDHLSAKEQDRLVRQAALDAEKSQEERNRLGQFATSSGLAEEMVSYALTLLPPSETIRFLDPAFGTGSFYSALLRSISVGRIENAIGYEIDPHYGEPAAVLWAETGFDLAISDFTTAKPFQSVNMLICNPPYVRHHHLREGSKSRLQIDTQRASGMKLSGLAGLYCYFLGLSHAWMAEGGVAGWLIPSEFMDVNYGQAVKRYLLERVTLLHIHRFDPNDVQFADALVSSAIVWFQNRRPPADHRVKFSFGGTLLEPRVSRLFAADDLAGEPKWTRFPIADVRERTGVRGRRDVPTLSHFFRIKRGIATGDNRFFILDEAQIALRGLPRELFSPILPSPRYLLEDEIGARQDGTPDIDRRLFLLDTNRSEEEIQRCYPALAAYLEEGKGRGLCERYLCKHRTLWYSQEHRPPAPIVCTYLGRGDKKRGKPFRFILNQSCATVANVYLALYPTPLLARAFDRDPGLLRRVWCELNALPPDVLLGEGRVYGGGLHKLEPRELGNVPAGFLADLLPEASTASQAIQLGLFHEA